MLSIGTGWVEGGIAEAGDRIISLEEQNMFTVVSEELTGTKEMVERSEQRRRGRQIWWWWAETQRIFRNNNGNYKREAEDGVDEQDMMKMIGMDKSTKFRED